MSVFVDTSALIAVIDADDEFHRPALEQWGNLLDGTDNLVTSNYVLLESSAVLQRRAGMEAVRLLLLDVQPALQIVLIDSNVHQLANSSLLAANRRKLSLVDLTSFQVMRERAIQRAFTFDAQFLEQGFTVVPDR